MNEQSLPQNYRGYSTAELLKMWREIPTRKYTGQPETPPGEQKMASAMRGLLMEYRLAPAEWGFVKKDQGYRTHMEQEKADMVQAKKLLAPFGIDPAPWADEEGNRQPELEAAWTERLRQREADRGKTISS
jgi:hypothetical protein